MTNTTLPPLRDVINAYELRAKKSFGQNFLLDLNLTGKIARIPGDLSNSIVYEVGPGPGGLTRALLAHGAKRVVAVEMDERCLAPLTDVAAAYGNRLSVELGNALKVEEQTLLKLGNEDEARIVSNLPYNVGTLLFIKWLTLQDWKPWYRSLTLMFQQEVAERIVAAPGGKAYGRLSVLAQWRGQARIAMRVPAAAFTPPPKVASAIVHFEPTEPIDKRVQLKDIEKVVEKAFGQRRKMLRASLKGLEVPAIGLLEAANLDPTLRAENVTVAQFVELARQYRLLKSSN